MSTPKITPEYLAELRKLADAATPGPWKDWWENPFYEETGKNGDYREIRDRSDKVIARVYVGMALNEVLAMADSEYIVAACSAIPALLDRIEKLEAMMPHRCDLCHYWAEKDGNYVCLKNNDFSRCWACWDGCNKWQLKEVK